MNRTAAAPATFDREQLLAVIRRHWGFDSLRPLQETAMDAAIAGRDSLLVLPTGGGKSLCYQAPAVLRGDTTVVISPLIALMKDQVDGLQACGVPAVQLNSSLSSEEQREGERAVVEGKVRLLFASPERMATMGFRRLLQRINVRSFAIDEAHCISHWGHDFRPEYRQLGELKRLFPAASVHAFTATATQKVRDDIVAQLQLTNAEVLVGSFDRPNLTYRVVPRDDLSGQALDIVRQHQGEAGIIYCLRRRDVDEITPLLKSAGVNAVGYHAGMEAPERKAAQDLFSEEKCDVVVATVAFGMGIDRSNIRYVLHTGMPKSIEHYQQETGRAGRDGLEAECVLLYSAGDVATWKKIMEKSGDGEKPVDPHYLKQVYRHLADMESYCRPIGCRHRKLVEYFGQTYEPDNCGACDLCLGSTEPVPEAATIAKKILSCVYRVEQRFGAAHVAAVLRGANTAQIRERGHDRLSTYGLLSEASAPEIKDWIGQLIGLGVLEQTEGEYPVLKLNAASWEVMKDKRSVQLVRPVLEEAEADASASRPRARRSRAETQSWEGVDQELFEALREERKRLAGARGVPPYLIFSDATLRELARIRPSELEKMHVIYGIGDSKLREFGTAFFNVLERHCGSRGLSRDNSFSCPRPPPERELRPSAAAAQAAILFRKGASLAEVARELDRAPGTVIEYLCEFILREKPASVARWVSDDVYHRVAEAAARVGVYPLKPLFVALNEQVPYDQLRIVTTHLRCKAQPAEG